MDTAIEIFIDKLAEKMKELSPVALKNGRTEKYMSVYVQAACQELRLPHEESEHLADFVDWVNSICKEEVKGHDVS